MIENHYKEKPIITTSSTGNSNDITKVELADLIDPQEGEDLFIEVSAESKKLNFDIKADNLNIEIISSDVSDAGLYLIELMVFNRNQMSHSPQPVEVTLSLSAPVVFPEP